MNIFRYLYAIERDSLKPRKAEEPATGFCAGRAAERGLITSQPLRALIVGLWLASGLALSCRTVSAGTTGEKTLMFVRQWDPNTGELIGWLPGNMAAIRLSILDDRKPAFDLNQTVNIEWLTRPKSCPRAEQANSFSKSREFAGQRWLPAQCDNIVRIAKTRFLIRSIIFGASRWQFPAQIVRLRSGPR